MVKVIDGSLIEPCAIESNLYARDFHAWIRVQTDLLKAGWLKELDLEHLVEELESMGVSQRSELKNRTRVLLLHLLKWQYQPGERSGSWQGTINEQRYRLGLLLEDSPSLGGLLKEAVAYAYPKACNLAVLETGLSMDAFPALCPFTVDQVLDVNYWPD